MSVRCARFLLLFVALWLPVQTMAALSMPLCRHVPEQTGALIEVAIDRVTEAVAAPHCHEVAAPAEPVAHEAACDNCELCHLACAGFMPSARLAAELIPAARGYMLPAIAAPPSHIVEPPQHPPREVA